MRVWRGCKMVVNYGFGDAWRRCKLSKKIKNKFLETPFLYFTSLLIGCCIGILGIALGDHPYGQFPSDSYTRTVLLISFPWIIFASLIVIIQREVPRPWNSSIRGAYAIFQGVVGLVISGGVETFLLLNLLQEIFRK